MSNTRTIAAALWFLTMTVAVAQNYPAASIADSLKQNAHSVVRLYEESFTVVSPSEGLHKIHSVTTVLDSRGQGNATVSVFHDKQVKIVDMEAFVYDAAGKQVKRMKRGDINDVNYVSDFSLFEDNKIKYADLKYSLYPYTVEYSYEVKTTNLMFYPKWFPQASRNTSVESSLFTITVPQQSGLRYKLLNGLAEPKTIDIADGKKAYSWAVQNKKVSTPEEMSPEMANYGPAVITAPTDFELEGRKGNMKTWKELGQFHYDLNKDRDILPDNVKAEVAELVKGITNPQLKIKKIYEYLQTRTRYVSIQLGIGGWQTFEAKTVAEKGYGDCKALSNYTKALLKAAGIEAFQALVDADEPDQFLDFPMANFNHVILCVPQPKDSIWLECTSQSNAFGYLGDFTGDRHVLLLTPTGGKLVKTPSYKPADNRQFRNILIKIDETGDGTASIKTHYSGLQQDTRSHVIELSPADQKEWLYKRVKLPSFEINTFSYKQRKDKIPSVDEHLELTVRQVASKSGNRMFVNPNLMTVWNLNLNPNLKRKYEIEWESGFLDMDTVTVMIPTNFKVEYAPSPLKIETKYGSYEISTAIKDDKVLYFRKMLMPKGLYAANQYAEVSDFFKKVAKADKSQIVLVRKE
jgi:transglutaminase-like putative cysteine protease